MDLVGKQYLGHSNQNKFWIYAKICEKTKIRFPAKVSARPIFDFWSKRTAGTENNLKGLCGRKLLLFYADRVNLASQLRLGARVIPTLFPHPGSNFFAQPCISNINLIKHAKIQQF